MAHASHKCGVRGFADVETEGLSGACALLASMVHGLF